MPVEHKTYGYQFKCGKKHSPNRAVIMQHEQQCWYNPEVKSCITCRFGHLEWEGAHEGYRTCELDDVNELEETEFDGIKPQVNCERWEVNPAWPITNR